MPSYQMTCPCGEFERVCLIADRYAPCETCGQTPEQVYRTTHTVIGDEMDQIIEHGSKHPWRCRSKAERRRWMKAQGLEEHVRHVPMKGSDKSPHTSNWAQVTDPYTTQNVKELLERAFAQKSRPEPPLNMRITHISGEGIGDG